jgi:S1-C subfamily serine protease
METADTRKQLFLETRGFRLPVDDLPYTMGHASTCEFQIEDDPDVSPHHAEIVRNSDGVFVLRDTGSDTGVLINGRRLVGEHVLEHGDVFSIGKAEFRAEYERMAAGGPTVAPDDAGAAEPAGADEAGSGAPGRTPPPQPKGSRPVKTWMILGGLAALVLVALLIDSLGGGSEPRTVSELVSEAKPSTLLVKGYYDDEPYGSGSGWVYDADEGLIVTNSHVLIGSDRFEVSLEGETVLRDAEVHAVAECDDIAMLKTEESDDLRTFPLLPEDVTPEQGEDVVALGYPNNASTADELQVTTGSLSALNINWDQPAQDNIDFAVYPDVHQVDAAINPGNSGGPLFDGEGKLIGMNSTRAEGDNQGFAIAVDRLREVLPGLAEGDSVGWGGFTFTAYPTDVLNNLAEQLDLVGGWRAPALLVESVIPGSAADEAGLTYLDGIYAINGEEVNSRTDYCDLVGQASGGEPVELSYYSADSRWADSVTTTIDFG